MGCTEVRYITEKGLYRGLDLSADELCTACITRNYPTDTTEIRQRSINRQQERLDSSTE